MRKIGVHFEISTDENGYRPILDVLECFNVKEFVWEVDNDAVHIIDDCGQITDNFLFDNEGNYITGDRLKNLINFNKYYAIFLTLRAFPETNGRCEEIKKNIVTATEFIHSNCEFLLSIVDYYYISILCKDEQRVEKLYTYVQNLGYVRVKYLYRRQQWNILLKI